MLIAKLAIRLRVDRDSIHVDEIIFLIAVFKQILGPHSYLTSVPTGKATAA
jgi:hypothetical protein